MRELIPMDSYGVFADGHDTARANSLLVAQYFNKSHNHVLRDIQKLDCSDEFRLSNFGQSSYINEQGKRQPCVCMTRDGFMFLVMGYRGKKAAAIKEAYIKRFNDMERLIGTLVETRQEFPLLTASIKLIHEHPRASEAIPLFQRGRYAESDGNRYDRKRVSQGPRPQGWREYPAISDGRAAFRIGHVAEGGHWSAACYAGL